MRPSFLLRCCWLPLLLLLPLLSSSQLVAAVDLSLSILTGGVDPASYDAFYDLSLAYASLQSEVEIQPVASLSVVTIAEIVQHKIDFGTVAYSLPADTAESAPSLVLLPLLLTALVPIYRLDALGVDAPPVVIGRDVMARIFMGEITWWNDTALRADNPELTMPEQPMAVMIQPGVAGLNLILKRALASFYPPFVNSSMTVSSANDFPTSLYAPGSLIIPPGATNLVTSVVANDGSFTVAWQSVAVTLGVSIASMLNKAGQVVTANSSTLSYAALELGSAPLPSRTSTAILTDASGAAAWPLAMFTYLLIDLNYSRTTCQAREVLVEFFLFCYQSVVAATLLAVRGYAILPDLIMTQLDIIEVLSTLVLCDGAAVLPTTVPLTRQLGLSSYSTSMMGLLMSLYTDPDSGSDVVWSLYTAPDQILLSKMVESELDVILINPDNVDAASYQALQDSGEFWLLPTFGLGVSWFTNPQLSTTINIAGKPLVMTIDQFALILEACLNDWADPRLFPLNPWLEAMVGSNASAVPMSTALGCGTTVETAPLLLYFQELAHTNTSDAAVTSCIAAFDSPGNPIAAAYATCKNLPQLYVFFSPTSEIVAPSLALGLYGCMAMSVIDGDPSKLYPSLAVTNGEGVTTIVGNSYTNFQACFADTFDPLTLTFDYQNSADPQCWPLTQQLVAVVRKQYFSSSTVTNSSSCTPGLDSLQLVSWLYNTDVSGTVTSAHYVAQLVDVQGVYAAYTATLNSVLCDGTTLLITLPVVWQLNTGIEALGYAASSLGIAMVTAYAAFTFVYRNHALIRSASPLFLSISFLGLQLMFGSIIALVSPVTASSCAAFNWLLNCGVMCTFGPLFAKTWRIYRIFGRRKLSVIKISNRKLLAIVSALFAVELILMTVWQSLSPLQPYLSVSTSGSPTVTTDYVQCGARGAGATMLAVIGVEKGLLFVFGALMAFSTRKVSSQFNDSSQVALSIYNVVFSTAIIGIIAFVIGATGDVLVGLILFVALWVGFFTACMLIVPKIIAILRPDPSDVGNANNGSEGVNSSGQFQFVSLSLLDTLPMVQSYIAALRLHFDLVLARESSLKRKSVVKTTTPSAATATSMARVTPTPVRTLQRSDSANEVSSAPAVPTSVANVAPTLTPHSRAQSIQLSSDRKGSQSFLHRANSEEQSDGVIRPMVKSAHAVTTLNQPSN